MLIYNFWATFHCVCCREKWGEEETASADRCRRHCHRKHRRRSRDPSVHCSLHFSPHLTRMWAVTKYEVVNCTLLLSLSLSLCLSLSLLFHCGPHRTLVSMLVWCSCQPVPTNCSVFIYQSLKTGTRRVTSDLPSSAKYRETFYFISSPSLLFSHLFIRIEWLILETTWINFQGRNVLERRQSNSSGRIFRRALNVTAESQDAFLVVSRSRGGRGERESAPAVMLSSQRKIILGIWVLFRCSTSCLISWPEKNHFASRDFGWSNQWILLQATSLLQW